MKTVMSVSGEESIKSLVKAFTKDTNTRLTRVEAHLEASKTQIMQLQSNQVNAANAAKSVLENHPVMEDIRQRHAASLEAALLEVGNRVIAQLADDPDHRRLKEEIKRQMLESGRQTEETMKQRFEQMLSIEVQKSNRHLEKAAEDNRSAMKDVLEARDKMKHMEQMFWIACGVGTVVMGLIVALK